MCMAAGEKPLTCYALPMNQYLCTIVEKEMGCKGKSMMHALQLLQ